MELKRGLPVGGQALPNGVMMRSRDKIAIALRLRSGTIVTDSWPITQKHIISKPILRGIYQLYSSFIASFQTIFRAIQLTRNAGEKRFSPRPLLWAAAAALLIVLYIYTSDVVCGYFSQMLFDIPPYLFALACGITDLLLFCLALLLISLLPTVKNLLKYHGAEHKAITCYEKGLEMTIENVKAQSRFHRRCGTSMVAAIFLAGIAAFVFMPPQLPETVQSLILAIIVFLAAGLSYEAMQSKKVSIISRMGLAAQRFTTSEPDEAMIECAISAIVKSVENT